MPALLRIVAAAVVALFANTPAVARERPPSCTVDDPTGTPLNVRDGPNGAVLTTLKRGAMVEVVDNRYHEGQRWALVARYAEPWGWVFGAYIKCDGSDGFGRVCTVADPTGTPLNVREAPNGPIRGTWENGMRVRPTEEKLSNGKLWYAAERFANDNELGWVFDPYLKCEEDGGH